MKKYIAVKTKFWIGHAVAVLWTILSIVLSLPWVSDLSKIASLPIAILIIAGIGYIPGYINAFMVMSLLLDRQPAFKVTDPEEAVTIIIACHNEEKNIPQTLKYIKEQQYRGAIKTIVVDNSSTDKTAEEAIKAAEELSLPVLLCMSQSRVSNALNSALGHVDTEYVITLDADTLLHKSAVKNLVSRMKSAPNGVVLWPVRFWQTAGRISSQGYRNGITFGHSQHKRLQGLYQELWLLREHFHYTGQKQ